MRTLLVMAMVFSVGCSSKRVLKEDNSVSERGVIKVWANWVKDKGEKFDIQFVMENISEKGIIVKLNNIQCARGKRTGRVKHTFFNTGERTIDLLAGENKQFNLVCYLGAESEGPFNMRIVKVYENPENDGESMGKVIAENLIWSLPEK